MSASTMFFNGAVEQMNAFDLQSCRESQTRAPIDFQLDIPQQVTE